jgi:hypothetical protein
MIRTETWSAATVLEAAARVLRDGEARWVSVVSQLEAAAAALAVERVGKVGQAWCSVDGKREGVLLALGVVERERPKDTP